MSFQIGERVMLNGKEYKIIGTRARSFLLERDGKTYKATADKMKRIINNNNAMATILQGEGALYGRGQDAGSSALARRVSFDKVFNPNAHAPETEAEIMAWFERLRCDLSPENLCCDGEASQAHIRNSLREIKACWKELEAKLGRKVAE